MKTTLISRHIRRHAARGSPTIQRFGDVLNPNTVIGFRQVGFDSVPRVERCLAVLHHRNKRAGHLAWLEAPAEAERPTPLRGKLRTNMFWQTARSIVGQRWPHEFKIWCLRQSCRSAELPRFLPCGGSVVHKVFETWSQFIHRFRRHVWGDKNIIDHQCVGSGTSSGAHFLTCTSTVCQYT